MNTLLDIAIHWFDLGIPPIPVVPKSKIPLIKWSRYIDCMPKRELIEDWFKDENRNIALICAPISMLSIIDFDNIPLWHKWKRKMSKDNELWKDIEKKTYSVRTSRGIHLYFITSNQELTRHNVEFKIDVKGQNSIVIAPPSIHPSGIHYKTICDEKPMKIDSIPVVSDCECILSASCNKIPDYVPDYCNLEDTPIQKIKKTVYIADIVTRFTLLKRSSNNGEYWMGYCPLHKDEHPSLAVNIKTNKCKCFSTECKLSGRWRDTIDLCVELYGLNKKTVVKNLIDEYNII